MKTLDPRCLDQACGGALPPGGGLNNPPSSWSPPGSTDPDNFGWYTDDFDCAGYCGMDFNFIGFPEYDDYQDSDIG